MFKVKIDFAETTIDVFFITIPRTLTKYPVPIHLLKQGTYNCVQKVEVALAEMTCVS